RRTYPPPANRETSRGIRPETHSFPARDDFAIVYIPILDRVVPPLDGVGLFKPLLNIRFHTAVVLRGDVQRLAVGILADLTLLDQHSSTLDDMAWQLEHGLPVHVGCVDCNVGVGPRAEMPFVLQSQDAGGSSPCDDRDVRERVFAVQILQHALLPYL